MKTTIDMAREVYGAHTEWSGAPLDRLEQLVALVRADERDRAIRENAYVLAEREACAKAVEAEAHMFETLAAAKSLANAIRNRGNT
jgi:hypothetical protein